MKQVAKLSEAVGEGRYEELLELLGRHPDKSSDALELDPNEEFRVVEGLLLADASGEIVRHPYVNNQLNKLLARWAFKTATGGGFRLPGFALMHDGYLFLRDGKVLSGSDWIPEHKAIVQLASRYGLCVRYPIRMVDDLLPFGNLSDVEIIAQLNQDLRRQNCTLTESEAQDLVARQLRLEGTYVLHSQTAKKNGGDYDFDWVCVVEEDRFPRFVKDRFSRGVGQQQGKNKADKARDPWFACIGSCFQPSRCETCPSDWPVRLGSYGVRTRSNPNAETTPDNVSSAAEAQAPVAVQIVGASDLAARNASEPISVVRSPR